MILPGDTHPMAAYRKRPVVIDAITFDELVKHGVDSGVPTYRGMPWSFSYNGHPVTHENDDLYLIGNKTGTLRFGRGDMLITGHDGEVYPCPGATFAHIYEPFIEPIPKPEPLPAWKRPWHRLRLWFSLLPLIPD